MGPIADFGAMEKEEFLPVLGIALQFSIKCSQADSW
jgi:hypothetical protein